MIEKVQHILKEIEEFKAESQEQLERFKSAFVGKKGIIGDLFDQLKNIAPEQRKEVGKQLNDLKEVANEKWKLLVGKVESLKDSKASNAVDLTLPAVPDQLGSIHPITQMKMRIIEIFERIGFNVSEGPEIESDWYNFSALNFPPDHPAREMQDTFFVEKNPDIVLRTHTSSVQIRAMENQKPPIRTLCLGRVYRNEAISARAHCFFHQVEGLYVGENVSFADLKQTLYHFVKEMFGKDTKIRFRPSYFPFTEPSAEVDISCDIDNPKGCEICGGAKNICKGTGWVEIAGSGMVHPNVLANCGIDPEKYTGFAFGMGLERMTQLKYRVNDLRMYSENDVRFLRQFSGLNF
ncbi:MAG: phenylalanine--tRNA ligase subunit alpha [Bacteroidetes bacterium]|nr:MAG: phenylalanine--tRNA ligase subunit alpha [Bacteroidota bacterium]